MSKSGLYAHFGSKRELQLATARPRPVTGHTCLLTAAGIAVSLGIIASMFPLLTRITRPDTARKRIIWPRPCSLSTAANAAR